MNVCPKCKSNMIVDIVYATSSNLILENKNNKIKFDENINDPSDNSLKCKSCGFEFGGLEKFLNDEFMDDDL